MQAKGLSSGPPQVPVRVPRGVVMVQAAPRLMDWQAVNASCGGMGG